MKPDRLLSMFSLILFCLFAVSCATVTEPVVAPQGEPTPEVARAPSIMEISFAEGEGSTKVHIEATEPFDPPYYKVASNPPRILIDLPKIDVSEIKEPVRIENGTISEILTTQYDDKGRIEIGLLQMTNYNLSREGKVLTIDIEKRRKAAEAKEAKAEESVPKREEPAARKEEIAPPVVESKKEGVSSSQPSSVQPPTSSSLQRLNPAREVLDVALDQNGDLVRFNILADGQLGNYNFFKMESPARLVVDLWEVDTRYPQRSIKISNPFIREVRMGRHPDKLRLVFDSLKPQLAPYQISRMEDRLIVSFGNVPPSPGPQIFVAEKTAQAVPASTVKATTTGTPSVLAKAPASAEPAPKVSAPEGASKSAASPATAPPKGKRANVLTGIDFKQLDDKSRVIVGLAEESPFESQKIGKKMIAVDIKNAFVPKRLQRVLDTSEFESAVNSINIQNIKTAKGNDVRILIKLREEVPFETLKEGKELFIDFEKPKKVEARVEPAPETKKEEAKKEEPKKEEVKAAPEVKEAKKEPAPSPVEEKAVAPSPEPKRVEEVKKVPEERGPEKAYTGRRVSLDFKDADIKNILRLIAEVSNLNIVAGEDVTGKITMRLVDVPWDQALDVVLQARALGMSRVGNVIRVAPLETLKKETQAELEARRAKERLEDLVTELIPVNYATGKELIPQVKSVLSERGDVKIDERTNILIVKDISRSIGGVKSLVKSLDTKTPQVMIEARIIEANLTFQRELGVSWGFETVSGKATGNMGTVKGGLAGNKAVDLPALPSTGTAGVLEFLFNSTHGLRELDIAISAHETKGDVRIISSPKIATLDNKEASIEQGLRIPYLKLTTEGTVTTDFIDANLKLTVTPHVTNDGNIKLNIKAKKDAPDETIVVQGVPSIDKKEAITEVLIKDNGVVVIAGIYTIEKNNNTEGIPLFSRIPLFGWLFKRETKSDTRKDLLIFICPKIIRDQA